MQPLVGKMTVGTETLFNFAGVMLLAAWLLKTSLGRHALNQAPVKGVTPDKPTPTARMPGRMRTMKPPYRTAGITATAPYPIS